MVTYVILMLGSIEGELFTDISFYLLGIPTLVTQLLKVAIKRPFHLYVLTLISLT